MFQLLLTILITVVAGLTPVAAAEMAVSPPAPPVAELVAQALQANPELEASEARWRMFVQQARQAGTFEDPMLMVGINNALIRDPLNFQREEMTSKVVGISQSVPFFGKRSLARAAAEQGAQSVRAEHEERRLELAAMVKESYAGLFFVEQALDVVGRNLRVMNDVIGATESRYGVGQAAQQDVLKAQLERSRMLDMQIVLLQQRRSLEAALNRLLFRPVATPIGRIGALVVEPLPLDAEQLVTVAEQNRPLLAGLAAREAQGRQQEQLAKRDFYPDFTFSLEYMQREPAMESEGYDMYSASVSFNLPVQRQRRHAMVGEAQAAQRMAQAEREVLRNDIRAGIADLLARMEKSRQLADLYRDGIIPQASRSFEAGRIAYQNNQVDFSAMLESLLMLFNYERDYFEAVADYRMTLARLEALIGRDLSAGSLP
ncbi:MAG: TolC family protein [Desulfuromonadales bacterium]|nr:TolC family protein [Desulfuromonadales bacterium]